MYQNCLGLLRIDALMPPPQSRVTSHTFRQISSCLGWKGQKRTSGFLENKLLFGSVFLYYSVYQTMVRKRRVTILPQSAEMCYHYKEVQRCDGKHTTSYSPTWGHLMVNYEWMNINLPAQLSSFLFVVTV